MNLSIYNVLSQLISGFLLYLVGLYILKLDPKYLDPITATAVAYIIGYFINSISAWLEWLLNWTWGGRPSSQLLKGKKCARIKFVEHEKMNRLLHEKVEGEKMTTDDLFKVAIRVADNEGRIGDMNGQYALARSILIAATISSVILGFKLYYNAWFWAITVVLVLSAWYRAKERGFYYAKEVLNNALNKLEK
jgi:hypothetical protein